MKIKYDVPEEVSVTLASEISSQQDANEPLSFIRLTVMLPVNGQDYLMSVAGLTPSVDVVSLTTSKSQGSSKRATTGRTRTLSTTNPAMSIESATDVTTAGTQPTTLTMTPTSDGQETKKKDRAAWRGTEADTLTVDSHGIPRHYKKAKGYANIQTRDAAIVRYYQKGQNMQQIATRMGLTRERIDQILRREGAK